MSEIDVKFCSYMISVYDLKSVDNYIPRLCELNERKNCKDISDCYYKQLQQLKAENEVLQSLNDFNVQKIETLEAENEELKEVIYDALDDFNGEYGTDEYDRLLVRASKHKIDISDFGEILYGKE